MMNGTSFTMDGRAGTAASVLVPIMGGVFPCAWGTVVCELLVCVQLLVSSVSCLDSEALIVTAVGCCHGLLDGTTPRVCVLSIVGLVIAT